MPDFVFPERGAALYRQPFPRSGRGRARRQCGIGAHFENDAGLQVRAKPLEHRLEAVWPNRQVLKHVGAGVVRNGGACQASVRLGHRDRDTGQRETALVLDRAVDLRRGACLCPGSCEREQQDQPARITSPATTCRMCPPEEECRRKWLSMMSSRGRAPESGAFSA